MQRFISLGLLGLLLAATAAAQTAHCHHAESHDHHAAESQALPTLPGQDAFGALAEIMTLLEADPTTDWSRVSIARLRDHLLDMNELTLHAEARETEVPGGLEIEVTGDGPTRAAVQRMVPAHAAMMNGAAGWRVDVETTDAGVRLRLTSDDARQVAKIRALGFFGFMASGDHHRPHHLAIARGDQMMH